MQDQTYSMRERELAHYILNHNSTIRETAAVFNMSKSNVHNDVSKRLKKTDYPLYEETHELLTKNFEEKHIRGGESTRLKYLAMRQSEK